MPFVSFMQSTVGRGLRVGLGAVLMIGGLVQIGGTPGLIVALVGIVPVVAGVFNFCLAGPLFGLDINGRPRAGGAH